MRRQILVPLFLVLLAVGACGEDDKESVQQTVRDFVKATNDRDGEKLCDELLTEEFIEAVTGAKGDAARKSCEEQFTKSQVRLGLGAIKRAKVDGDKATVTAEIEVQGQRQLRPFPLKKEDGEWRLAGSTGE
jgi:predicted lipid-binding transport protein (Tim44 family)